MTTKVLSDILRSVKEEQVQAIADHQNNFRQKVNEPAFSDVVFVCNDGRKVQAARMLLSWTSTVFKSMLTNGMAESSLSEIILPEISSPVLLSVFEFLYTGSLLDYRPRTWKMGCEIKLASRFFLLPRLDMITNKFMINHIISVAEDLPAIASLLTQAVGFKALCDERDVILRALVTILTQNRYDSAYIAKLSEDAMHYFLTSTNSLYEDCNELPFQGYLRFKQIIRWWVYQSGYGSRGAEELVDFITGFDVLTFLHEHIGNEIYRLESQMEDIARLSNEWSFLLLEEASSNSVARLFGYIDCAKIHPVRLESICSRLTMFVNRCTRKS